MPYTASLAAHCEITHCQTRTQDVSRMSTLYCALPPLREVRFLCAPCRKHYGVTLTVDLPFLNGLCINGDCRSSWAAVSAIGRSSVNVRLSPLTEY